MAKATQDIITDDDRVWVASQYAVCRTTKVIVDELMVRVGLEDTPENRTHVRSLIQTAQPSSPRFSKKYQEVYDQVRDAWKKGINDYALFHRSGRIRFYDELLIESRKLLKETEHLEGADKIKAASAVIKNMQNIADSVRSDGDTFDVESDLSKAAEITTDDITEAIREAKNGKKETDMG